MIDPSYNPYDLLRTLEIRCTMLEKQVRELQLNEREMVKGFNDQAHKYRELLNNEQVLSEALNVLLREKLPK